MTVGTRSAQALQEAPVRQETILTFGEALAGATKQAMEQDERVFIYGEGINDPGGFFGSTAGLHEAFSEARCFDVPNSEEALAGFGIGAALMGLRPVFVNLRIEFLMLAMNQLVNHAARLPAMSGYQYTVPLTVRAIVGKSWGQAAQHASALHAMFANVPGLQVVVPSGIEDAPGLLLAAIASDEPTIFIELKSLYEGKAAVRMPFEPIPMGRVRVARRGSDVTCVAISDMVGFAQRVADLLAPQGIEADVLDLRTLAPLDAEAILASVAKTQRVAVFDAGWEPFGLAAEVARIVSTSPQYRLAGPLVSVSRAHEQTPASCFLEGRYYPSEADAAERIRALVRGGRT